MVISLQELEMYKNFDELAEDVLGLAKEIMPDQLFYLTTLSDTQQTILKLSNDDTDILITEGMVIDLKDTICDRIDFENNRPLVFEDLTKEPSVDYVREGLEETNIKSYLGIPISLVNGQRFGTLCAANDETTEFDDKSISLLQRIVRMFSYYLELERCAYRDPLTDLYNRHYLSKYFADHSKMGGVLFFLDLDGFKKVNDMHGHETGDLVLKEVASRLQDFAKEQNDAFVVRLGGDEFIINFPHIFNKAEMCNLSEQVLHYLSAWGTDYELSASVGIAPYPADSNNNLSTLLKNADIALYRAKAAGKNNYQFF